ncbi:hypothetical protein QYF36_002811 [Acer negundo]|nr:hypothetical protein QYF36_002811 [Acer negundo]
MQLDLCNCAYQRTSSCTTAHVALRNTADALITTLIPLLASGGNSNRMAFATSSRSSGHRLSAGKRCGRCLRATGSVFCQSNSKPLGTDSLADVSEVHSYTSYILSCLHYYFSIRGPSRTKLDDKAIRCAFMGYSSQSKGYQCYDPSCRRMFHSLNITFWEDTHFFTGPNTRRVDPLPNETISCPIPIVSHDVVTPIIRGPTFLPPIVSGHILQYSRRPRLHLPESFSNEGTPPTLSPTPTISSPRQYPIRDRHPSNCLTLSYSTNHPIKNHISYSVVSSSFQGFLGQLDSTSVPRSVGEALLSSEWIAAM